MYVYHSESDCLFTTDQLKQVDYDNGCVELTKDEFIDRMKSEDNKGLAQCLSTLMDETFKNHRQKPDYKNSGLGMGIVGHECPRVPFYRFRKVKKVSIPGRIERLLDSGHTIEDMLVEQLKIAGFTIYDKDPSTGKQWRVHAPKIKGFKGFLDLIGVFNLTTYVGDIKSANNKQFDNFCAYGLKEWEPKYYHQLNLYMGYSYQLGKPIKKAFVMVYNKDTSEIKFEIIDFDQEEFNRMNDRALLITTDNKPPTRLSEDPTFYKCANYCDYYNMCHNLTEFPQVNCRTCAHWSHLNGCGIGRNDQQEVCDSHIYNPYILGLDIVKASPDVDKNYIEYKDFTNTQYRDMGDQCVSSYELFNNGGSQLQGGCDMDGCTNEVQAVTIDGEKFCSNHYIPFN